MSSSFDDIFPEIAHLYKDRDRVRSEVVRLIGGSNTLRPRVGHLQKNDDELTVLMISGTIPIVYQSQTYKIPIDLYIMQEFPSVPPLCFVVVLEHMSIVPKHKYVDHSGRCYLPYLSTWDQSSTLVELVTQLSHVFSVKPPLYQVQTTSNANIRGTHVATQPVSVEPSAPPEEEPPRRPQDEDRTCVICLDRERTHACLPCGHKVLCDQCALLLRGNRCPICREVVDFVARIYE